MDALNSNVVDSAVRVFTVGRRDARQRLDLTLCRRLADVHPTRTRVQSWIALGQVARNGVRVTRAATRLVIGDVVAVCIPQEGATIGNAQPSGSPMNAEAAHLDVLFEDEHLLIVNKPAGLVVHPGYQHTTGTLMNALLWRARLWPPPQRPSIVGRLDKLTSGLVLVAKSSTAHAALQRALAAPTAVKAYLAVAYGRPPRQTTIRLSLRRDSNDRRRVVASAVAGAQSLTRVERLVRAPRARVAVVRCTLGTGRMHQIRAHLAARGWPIVGDPTYGQPRWSDVPDAALRSALRSFPRQALHASSLSITHPFTRRPLSVEAPLPQDLDVLLGCLGVSSAACRA